MSIDEPTNGFNCCDCEWVNVCEQCCSIHMRKKHVVFNHWKEQPDFCREHRLVSLLYCYDCKDFICNGCIKRDHKGHGFADIVEAANTDRYKLILLISPITIMERRGRKFKALTLAWLSGEPNQMGDAECVVSNPGGFADDLCGNPSLVHPVYCETGTVCNGQNAANFDAPVEAHNIRIKLAIT